MQLGHVLLQVMCGGRIASKLDFPTPAASTKMLLNLMRVSQISATPLTSYSPPPQCGRFLAND